MPASPGAEEGELASAGLLVGRAVGLAPTSDGPLAFLKAAKSVMSGEIEGTAGAGALARAGAAVCLTAGTAGPPTSAIVAGMTAAPVGIPLVALTVEASDAGRGRFTMPCRCNHSTPPVPASSTTAATVPRSHLRRDGRGLAVAAAACASSAGGWLMEPSSWCSRVGGSVPSCGSRCGRVPRSPGRRMGDPRGAPMPSRSGVLVMCVSMTATCWVGENSPSRFDARVANAAGLFTGARRRSAAPGTRRRRSRWPRSRQSGLSAQHHGEWPRAGRQPRRRPRRPADPG